MNAIEVKHLTKAFGGLRAVDNLSVMFPRRVATGLIGPNGSGKTTLMNLLTGTLSPDCGEIVINNSNAVGAENFPPLQRVNPTDLRRLKIARTFQDGRLINQMSVVDNLLLAISKTGIVSGLMEFAGSTLNSPSLAKGRRLVSSPGVVDNNLSTTTPPCFDPSGQLGTPSPAKGNTERVETILQKIHLYDHRDALAESLSYGQRKLLELGRAMIQDADVYLLDEPFTGLFPAVVEQVAELLGELKNKGKTLVIIEHNIGLIRRLCDNIIVLDHGHLLANGSPEEVLKNKQVQEAYLGV